MLSRVFTNRRSRTVTKQRDRRRPQPVLKHIKTFVNAVFKLAKQQGYYEGERTLSATLQRLLERLRLRKRMPTT